MEVLIIIYGKLCLIAIVVRLLVDGVKASVDIFL
jgi:hypothetical protein